MFDGILPKPDLSRPSLAGLSWLLKNPQEWPEGFVWEYVMPCGCAMGLATRLWGVPSSTWPMALALGMPYAAARKIFIEARAELELPVGEEVSHAHVATLIDRYIAGT